MRTKVIQIRLQSEEKAAFRDAAKLADLPLSVWARAKLRLAAAEDLSRLGQPLPVILSSKGPSDGSDQQG